MKSLIVLIITLVLHISITYSVLDYNQYKHYVDEFNHDDDELYKQLIPNEAAWLFLKDNIPLLDCPDKVIEKVYYFRWWTYRKHIKEITIPSGSSKDKNKKYYVITEFLPNVSWSGPYNTIPCAAAHHFREGRWLKDKKYLASYAKYWLLENQDNIHQYSFWVADSILAFSRVNGDFQLACSLLPSLIKSYNTIKKTNYIKDMGNGMYFNTDNRDGMEASISGHQCYEKRCIRPTLNSYQFGDAMAISHIAALCSDTSTSFTFRKEAAQLKKDIDSFLWDKSSSFYKVLINHKNVSKHTDVRELIGYTPWYFHLPDPDKDIAWKQLMDRKGFFAKIGLTTAEQRHPNYLKDAYPKNHECLWDGPSWPYATSVTLTALSHFLNRPSSGQHYITNRDYYTLLWNYANAHKRKDSNNKYISWIDENYHPETGDWISRTLLSKWTNGTWSAKKGGKERGKDYNHSTFVDLIISGLIGLRSKERHILEINPLIQAWSYFCLDHIYYHGFTITILFDKTGEQYQKGKGFMIFINHKLYLHYVHIKKIRIKLPNRDKLSR